MATLYVLKSTASDLSAGGAFNQELSAGAQTPSTVSSGNLAAGTSADGHAFTVANNPSADGTSTGAFTVKVEVTTGQTDFTIAVALARVNSAGTQQAVTAFTATQAGTAGVKTFSGGVLTNPALGIWAAGDRLRVDVRFTRAAGGHGSTAVVSGTGSDTNDTVDAPWTIVPSTVASAESATVNFVAADATVPEVPQTVTGLRLWLAARKETGLTNGAGVATPTNWAGLGNTLTQATGTAQPTYQTAVLDGQPVFRFAVANAQRWSTQTGDLVAVTNAASGLTAFVVAKVASFASTTQQFVNFDSSTGGAARFKCGHRFVTAEPDRWFASGRRLDADAQLNASVSSTQVAVDTNWHLHTVVPDWANGQVSFYREQTADGTGITWTSAGTTSATNSVNVSVGAKDSGTEALNGDIAELLIYDRVLSQADREAVWGYLTGIYSSLAAAATVANAQAAAVTVAAADALAVLAVNADTATVPVTAADGLAALAPAADAATLGVAATDAQAALVVSAEAATVGFAAADATVPTVAATVGIGAIRWVAAVGTTASAGPASVTFTAADATAALGVQAEAALRVDLVASEGVTQTTVDAGSATVAFAAADATVSVSGATTASAESATVTVAAADASVATTFTAGAADVPLAAADALAGVGGQAGAGSVPVAAQDAATAIVVSADAAAVPVAAADATISTVTQTTADAQPATLPVTAGDASVAVVVVAGSATVAMVAADAGAPGPVDAQPAAIPVAATDASVAVVALAGAATVGLAAADASFVRFTDVSAQPAAVTLTAADAQAALEVVAAAALVPLVATDASVFIPPPVPPPRWVEGATTATSLLEGAAAGMGQVEGELVGAGIVEGGSSL